MRTIATRRLAVGFSTAFAILLLTAAAARAADPASGFSSAAMEAMDRMMTHMHGRSSGDVDRDFVNLMVPHHQGAIDMAVAELRYGRNARLKRIAQEIIIDQQQEIVAMDAAVGARRPEPAPAPTQQPAPGPWSVDMRAGLLTRTSAGFAAFALAGGTAAQQGQAPWGANMASSHRDRLYAAEQFSNTVSVTDPLDGRLLGLIRLGDPQPANFSPLYRGQLLVHGLGFSPDGRTLAVVSIGSNSVTFIDTATNIVKHTTYVGRSPHEAFFTPDGKEVWVTVRGEDYVAVLDPLTFTEKLR